MSHTKEISIKAFHEAEATRAIWLQMSNSERRKVHEILLEVQPEWFNQLSAHHETILNDRPMIASLHQKDLYLIATSDFEALITISVIIHFIWHNHRHLIEKIEAYSDWVATISLWSYTHLINERRVMLNQGPQTISVAEGPEKGYGKYYASSRPRSFSE